jgi:hypothetical protein
VTASPDSLSVSGSDAPTPETEPVTRRPEADTSPEPGPGDSGSPEPSAPPGAEAEQNGSIRSVADGTTTETGPGTETGVVRPLTAVDVPHLLTGLGW